MHNQTDIIHADALPLRGSGGRPINFIIIHCSAVKPNQTSSVKQIDAWHKAKGWKQIGYHYVIRRDGTIEVGRPEAQPGAHTVGHNFDSIAICYEGGLDEQGRPRDTRTPEQKDTMQSLIAELRASYPHAKVAGHNQFSNKPCPCFDVASEY